MQITYEQTYHRTLIKFIFLVRNRTFISTDCDHWILHLLLLITIKQGTICMSQRPIKRKNMNVSGFDSELYDTRIQYKNLNIHKHSLSFKGIQHLAMNIK